MHDSSPSVRPIGCWLGARALRGVCLLALSGLLIASSSGGAWAQASTAYVGLRGAPDLETLLLLQRTVYPAAVVSGTFYEWRATSVYRSVAGLHLGYDVAMPARTPAVAGWAGQVTRIQRWHGAEHGITVLSPSGFEATYGHLSPCVKVGDVVNAGDVVGLVVNDHVDVKMRGPDGAYFDFGHSVAPVAGVPTLPMPLRPTRADALRAYEVAWYGMQLDQEELRRSKARLAELRASLAETRSQVRRARADLPRVRRFLDEGLVARIEVERALTDVHAGTARVIALQADAREAGRDVEARSLRLRAVGTQLDTAWKMLAAMGVTRAELARRLRAPASPLAAAQARELAQMRVRARVAGTTSGRGRGVAAARIEADRMNSLFEQGVVSRAERDRARSRYEALRSAR